jgi:phosphate uptake regulator
MLGNLFTDCVAWAPGILAALGILVLCWKGVTAFVKIIEAARKIDGLSTKVATIEHEFSPNSGTSMRDQVDAVRNAQALALSQMADHMRSDAEAFKRQDRFNTKIEGALERIEDHIRGK